MTSRNPKSARQPAVFVFCNHVNVRSGGNCGTCDAAGAVVHALRYFEGENPINGRHVTFLKETFSQKCFLKYVFCKDVLILNNKIVKLKSNRIYILCIMFYRRIYD